MVNGWLGSLFDLSKLPAKFVAALWIMCSCVLFAPIGMRHRLHVDVLPDPYGTIVGIAWLVCSGLLATSVGSFAWTRLAAWRKKRRYRLAARPAIDRLDRAERLVLREFRLQNRQVIVLPIDEPSVAGLLSKGMLQLVGQYGRPSSAGLTFNVRLHADIARELRATDVGLSDAPATGEEMLRFLRERPAFIATCIDDEDYRGRFL